MSVSHGGRCSHQNKDETFGGVKMIIPQLKDEKIKSYVESIEIKYRKKVLFDDIVNDPRKTSYLLGTYNENDLNIFVYLNKALFFRDELVKHTIIHELIHCEMDKEGYPITRNIEGYKNDVRMKKIGTALVDAVIHIELNSRQKEAGLFFVKFEKASDSLAKNLVERGIEIASQREFLDKLLFDDQRLSVKDAFDKLRELIVVLGFEEYFEIISGSSCPPAVSK